MNRRKFLTSAMAVSAVPAMPLKLASLTQTPSIPHAAKVWSSYMTQLHGACTPKMLSTMIGVSVERATVILNQLVAIGHIKPNHLVAPKATPSLKSQPVKAVVHATRTALTRLRDHLARHATAAQIAATPFKV